MQKKTIAVIFGGNSTEYEVSLQSAFSVFENINKEKFDIVPVGITRSGEWYHYTGEIEKIAENTWFTDEKNLYSVAVSQNRSVKGFIEFKEDKCNIIKVDLVFPVLHGKNGEDGTLQGLFELAGIAVVGCDTRSSALCMDKDKAHKLVSLAGIALYGVLSSPNDKTKLKIDLKPVLSLKARVVLLRTVKKGESVGYSRAFTASKDSLIAILPIGYADGFPRNLSCKNSYVLIDGQQAPVIGKICMDQLAVDVTDIFDVRVGSTATLIGKDGNCEITAPMVAKNCESITNELLSRMGHRLKIIRKNVQ